MSTRSPVYLNPPCPTPRAGCDLPARLQQNSVLIPLPSAPSDSLSLKKEFECVDSITRSRDRSRDGVSLARSTGVLRRLRPAGHLPIGARTLPQNMADVFECPNRNDKRLGPRLNVSGRLPVTTRPLLSNAMLPCLLPGTIIATCDLAAFFKNVHHRIGVPYVLVHGTTDGAVHPLATAELERGDSNLVHLFSVNPSAAVADHPKFSALPLGLDDGSGWKAPQVGP